MYGCLSYTPHTGDLAHNPGMCPDWELNRPPFGLQAGIQFTEPYQPGLVIIFLKGCKKDLLKIVELVLWNEIYEQFVTYIQYVILHFI